MGIIKKISNKIFRLEDIKDDYELEVDLVYQVARNQDNISKNLPYFIAIFAVLYALWVPAWIMVVWAGMTWSLLYLGNKQLNRITVEYEDGTLTKESFYKYRNLNWIIRGIYYFVFGSVSFTALLVDDHIFAILPIAMITSSMAMSAAVMAPYPRYMVVFNVLTAIPLVISTGFFYDMLFFEVCSIGLVLYTLLAIKLGFNLYDAYKSIILQRRALSEAKLEAEDANKAKGRFLATMSHEVRTPLNGILGMANLLSDTQLNGKQSNYLDTIRYSGETLLTMLNDILDFSKMESGKFEIEEIDFDLPKVIESVVMLMRSRAEEKNIEITEDIHLMVPQRIKSDPTRLRQVLLNLISNAIKFTDEGGVTVKVTNLHEDGDFADIKFEVIDTGIGIPEDAQKKLFKEFAQADSSTSRKYGGTGLGLSICQQIVGLMKGKIGIESEAGVGSTFWFEIPVEVSDVDTFEYMDEEDQKVAIPDIEPLNILLVDDNEINLAVAGDTLEKYGHASVKARNGQEAVDAVKESTDYDIILMDMQMPVMDGLQASREIKALGGEASNIPIIALTANAMHGDEETCLVAGMVDHIPKPFETHQMFQTIAKYVPHKMADKAKKEKVVSEKKITEIANDDESQIDMSTLENIEETLGRDYMINFLENYVPSLQLYVNEITEFSKVGKMQDMQHRAHELKTMSAMFGMTDVQSVAQGIESCCQEGRHDDAKVLAEKIDARFSKNLAALQKIFPDVQALAS